MLPQAPSSSPFLLYYPLLSFSLPSCFLLFYFLSTAINSIGSNRISRSICFKIISSFLYQLCSSTLLLIVSQPPFFWPLTFMHQSAGHTQCMGPKHRHVNDIITSSTSVCQIHSSTCWIVDLVSMSPLGVVFYDFLFLFMYFFFRSWPLS